jgi:hypothetical protein
VGTVTSLTRPTTRIRNLGHIELDFIDGRNQSHLGHSSTALSVVGTKDVSVGATDIKLEGAQADLMVIM